MEPLTRLRGMAAVLQGVHEVVVRVAGWRLKAPLEYGTVISGSFGAGVGATFERTGELLKPGSFWMHPARHPHFGWTGDDGAVIQIHFVGPGGIEYVNPADDPRKKAN
jgi:hypothetical protein